ncbi:hypothetical protein FOMA001_g9802 [Fusarium oxysporum f. sp. matthiolae]|nr:hypothetical protein FOMA001_g9802 [Fusarium oxysporum f. sp. matthiolae]
MTCSPATAQSTCIVPRANPWPQALSPQPTTDPNFWWWMSGPKVPNSTPLERRYISVIQGMIRPAGLCIAQSRVRTLSKSIANNMRRSFPSIPFGLMVGIGGGVPGKVDVRLDDVVVNKESGVIRFREDCSRRPFSANRHSKQTPTGIHDCCRQTTSGSQIRAQQNTLYPLQDARKAPIDDRILPSCCKRCDVSRLVRRPARSSTDPKIHCGIIASANQVMKHGRTRDQLAEELDVLCFEMEAAGLMDSFPCLVVRGICDYSDSHKNNQWQEYAAATAAAYAKELLSVILTNSINQTQSAMMSSDADRQLLQERRIRLLGLLEFKQIHARRMGLKAAHDKTCRWLLEDPAYQRWLDPAKLVEYHGFLWIKGNPGVGKSTTMKVAYSHARQTMGSTVVVSFFFDARG